MNTSMTHSLRSRSREIAVTQPAAKTAAATRTPMKLLRSTRLPLLFTLVALLAKLLLPTGALAGEAASSVVTTAADVSDSHDNLTSLREAIKHVQNGDVSGPVTFDPVVFATPTTITLDSVNNPLIILSHDIEIDGSAAGVTISGGDAVTIFDVFGTGGVKPNVTLKNLTIAHGHGPSGGGILTSDLDGNSAPNLTLIGCTFSDNLADALGGAIYNSGAIISASNCTFSRNQAAPTGSSSGDGGGAICEPRQLLHPELLHDRFNSTGASGGGIRIGAPASPHLSNSIVGNNTARQYGPDASGNIGDYKSNILGNSAGANFVDVLQRGPTGSLRDVDPGLVPIGLANNGGPTQTIALQFGSPAIDRAFPGPLFEGDPPLGLPTDQRGQPRPVQNPASTRPTGGNGSDSGAFEFQLPTIVNNFGNNADKVSDVIGSQGIAQAFTTDSQVYRLNTVNLRLLVPGGGTEKVELQLRANNDKNNLPGEIIQTWTNVTVTGSAPQDIVRTSTTSVLSANTQYWLVVKAVSGGQVNWLETSGTANSGVGTLGKLVTANDVNATPAWKPAQTAGTTLLSVTATVALPTVLASLDNSGGFIAGFDASETQFLASNQALSVGVRVASADFDGDGVADSLVGAGPGAEPNVLIFRGSDGSILRMFDAFKASYNGGVYVAAGDVNGDGVPDIIVGIGLGGNEVKVFSGKNGSLLKDFTPFNDTLDAGGVRVAAGDLDGDGFADIIVAGGPNGNPGGSRVRVFSGKTGALLYDFLPYGPDYHGGVFVACGDVYGTGTLALVTGTDAGVAGEVEIFSGPGLSLFSSFSPPNTTAGVRVATADLNGDGTAEIIVSSGPNGNAPVVQVYSAASPSAPLREFLPFPGSATAGCFVAGAVLPQLATLPITVQGAGTGRVTGAKLAHAITHKGGPNPGQGSIDVRFTQTFKLTATPSAGSSFYGWEDQNGSIVGYHETSTFRMAPGLALQALFVPSPFTSLGGIYNGTLIFDDGSARGHIVATVGTDGSVTLQVSVGTSAGITTVTLPEDQILGNGEFDRTITVKGIGVMDLHFTLALNPVGAHSLSGTLTQVHVPGGDASKEVSATFTAKSQEFAKKDCPFAGRYTMVLNPPNFAPASFPQGYSGLQVVVAKDGRATFSGLLGDGTLLVASFRTSLDGECAFFFPLYQKKGFLGGTLHFRDAADTDIDGTLTWAKPAIPGGTYPGGFFGQVDAQGTHYTPVAGQRLILNPNGAGTIGFSEPATTVNVTRSRHDLPESVPDFSENGSLTLDANDVLHLPDLKPDLPTLTCTIRRSNGTFRGTFKEKFAIGSGTFTFIGVIVLPKGAFTGEGVGTLLRGATTGAVRIFPQ